MTQNILIEFDSKTQGITLAEQAVERLAGVDKQLAATFAKTNNQLKERDKLNDTLAGGLGELVAKFKDAQKAAVGAFGTKGLADFKKNLLEGKDALRLLFTAIGSAGEKLKGLSKDSEAFNKLQADIDEATEVFKELTAAEEEAVEGTQSFKSRLRELKEELSAMEDAGLDNTQTFREMAVEAGKLEDQIGDTAARIKVLSSDTFAFDAAIGGVQGLTAAFQAGEGAMQLFGDENKDLQEALVKLNALMAITQGLQQLRQTLEAQSAIVIAISNAQQKISILQTNLQAAAESKFIVVRGAAAVAQRVLNAVMAANPAGILLVTLGALASLLIYFTSNTRAAANATAALNGALSETGGLLDAELKGIETANKNIIASLKERGATDKQIAEQEFNNTVARREARQRALVELQKTLYDEKVARELSAEDFQKLSDKELELQFAIKDDETELLSIRAENRRKAYLDELSSATAFAEARVIVAKRGSREELNAEIAAVQARRNEQLKSNPNLTAGDRVKIEAEAQRQIKDLRFNFEKAALEDAKRAIDARVLKAEEGTRDELDFRIAQLAAQRDIELKDQELTKNKRLLIEANFQKERTALITAYNQKIAEDTINARVSELNARISALDAQGAQASADERLSIRKKLIDDQGALEILGIQASIDTEENKRTRINAVYAKELADKKQLERDKISAEIDSNLAFLNAGDQLQANRAKRVLDNQKASVSERAAAEQRWYNYLQSLYQNDLDAQKEKFEKGIISYQEYQTRLLQITDQQEALRAQKSIDAEAKKQQAIQAIQANFIQIGNNIAQAFSERNLANIDREIEKVQELKDQKIISETEAQNRIKVLRRQAAQAEKNAAIFSAFLSQSLAVLSVLRDNTIPAPLKPIAIAAAIGAALSQMILIASRPLPQLYKGTKRAKAGWYRTGELGPEFEWHKDTGLRMLGERGEEVNYIQEGARVFNAYETTQMLKTMQRPYEAYNFPAMKQIGASSVNHYHTKNVDIDYDKIGQSVAKHQGKIEDLPSYEWNVDNEGLSQSVIRNNRKTEFVNKKYRFKS